jgi:hypothetical protein
MGNYLHEMSLERYHLLLVAGQVLNSEVYIGFDFQYHHHYLAVSWFALSGQWFHLAMVVVVVKSEPRK